MLIAGDGGEYLKQRDIMLTWSLVRETICALIVRLCCAVAWAYAKSNAKFV